MNHQEEPLVAPGDFKFNSWLLLALISACGLFVFIALLVAKGGE